MLQIALGLLVSLTVPGAPTVTVQSLLREMSDRSTFARLPVIPYKQFQASSYDRLETDPNDAKTWFANADYGQFIRTEQRDGKTEWVVMEHSGPGAITRIWTPLLADKDKMLVRFYLDGGDQPTIEEPFNELMRGKCLFKPPFAFISWPEAGVESGVGSDLYYPISFAKGCKVTFSELPFYYSIDYRAYPPRTAVQTFSKSIMAAEANLATTIGNDIQHPRLLRGTNAGAMRIQLPAGGDFHMALPKGPWEVEALDVRFDRTPDREDLRANVIEMSFDGEPTVWCPIGEFFGCGIHDRPVWDRFRQVREDGSMACVWPMPYKSSAQLGFHNYGRKPISFRMHLTSRSCAWDARSLHFHSTWRGQYPLATRPMSDWNYLEATGNGVYVGDTLTVFSPVAAWYGEGDERVYVDGEKFPSHLGTGTEDYYGYAWGMAEHYSSSFISMPLKDLKGRDNWSGYTTTSRIRGLDAIPFDKSLKFDMEIWNWADCKVGYSAATFWYARPGATSNRKPMPTEVAAPLPEWSKGFKGAVECEDMKVLSKSSGLQVSTQSGALSEGAWSNNTQLFLQATKPGDFIELQVPVTKTGRYHVRLYATKSYDYGIVRVSLSGRIVKEIDLWNAKPAASGPIGLGNLELKQGAAVLRCEVLDTNPRSTGAHFYFGLDCIVL